MNDIYETKDKQITPFLLTRQDIKFLGTKVVGRIIYFQFSPREKALELVNLFITRKVNPVQPKDLLEAVETYRDFVFSMKEKNQYEIIK